MENLHKKSGKYISRLILVLIIIYLNSCTRIEENSAELITISSAEDGIAIEETFSMEKITTLTPEVISKEDQIRRRDFPVISIDNVSECGSI